MFRKIGDLIGTDSIAFTFSFMKKDGFLYALGVFLTACSRLLENVFTGQLYKLVTQITSDRQLIAYGILRVFVILVILILFLGFGIMFHSIANAGADFRLRRQMGERLTRLPLSDWHKYHSGEWLAILGKEADAVSEMYKSQIPGLLGLGVQIFGGFAILMFASRELAVFSLISGVLYLGIGLFNIKRNKRYSGEQRKASARATAKFSDILSGFMVIRIYRHFRDFILKLHDREVEEVYNAGQKMSKIHIINGALGALGYTIGYSGAFILGLLLVYNNKMELSNMLAMWPISLGVSFSIMSLGFYVTDMQPAIAAAQRVREVFGFGEEVGGEDEVVGEEEPLIEFKNVSFAYEGEQPVLQDVSFTIGKGERVAFVGESGSGKSTLVKLVMNLYRDYSGEILFGGKSIKSYTLKALRSNFSYAPQTTHLLSDTIYQNIAIVKEASPEEVYSAAKRAHADEFIMKLPEKYLTNVGDDGVLLSGGQRQRISIARAFLKNSPVLIFDEITASLDGESETLIYKALQNADRRQAMLLITHRLSTTAFADRIIVMDNGEISESGTHDELIAKNGIYKNLWQLQH